MGAAIKDLYDFIDTALRNRKYPPNTAQGYKAALRVFEAELNDEEKTSVQKTLDNIDQISNLIFGKNKISAGSLATYKSRLIKVVADYEKYGTDATKMANWSPKVIAPRVKRTQNGTGDSSPTPTQTETDAEAGVVVPANMHKIELALRPDAKFVLIIPRDLKTTEVTTLEAILKSLINEGGNETEPRVQETPTE
jgi:hypothetical protein